MMRKIVFGAFLLGLAPACLLLSPLDEATPDTGYGGKGGTGTGGKGTSGGSAGKGGSSTSGGGPSGGSGGSGTVTPHTCSDPNMIDDMEAPSHTTNICESDRTGGWYIYTDGTGTTDPAVSTDNGPPFPYSQLSSPRSGSTYAAHVTASGQTVFGGGMGVGMNFPDAPYDATAYAGIQFWARGTGSIRVDFSSMETQETIYGGRCVPTALECGDHYHKSITLTSNWQQHTIRFNELNQQGFGVPAYNFFYDELLGINFAWTVGASADIWIDDLRFLEPDCDSDTAPTSCPTASSYTFCSYNSEVTYDCNSYCPTIGFAATPECTPDFCVCGAPLRTDCNDGALFLCDCLEYVGTPCEVGEDYVAYRGCFRGAQGYESVSCFADYAVGGVFATGDLATDCTAANTACFP